MVKSSGSPLAQISHEILKSNGHYLPSDLATPGFNPSVCRNTAKCLTRLLITIFFFLLCSHNHRVVWICLCCHNAPNSDMDYRIFNVRTDVNAVYRHRKRICTESLQTPKENLHGKLALGRSLAAPGNRTCVSGMSVRCFST